MAHGIMFHHFHSNEHPERSGSISANDLDKMIELLQKDYRVVEPEEFRAGLLRGNIEENSILLTFDDGLKCQIDVALPVLESKSLKGLFNIYTGVLENSPPPLEIFSYFRETAFENFQEFWGFFFEDFSHKFPLLAEDFVASYPADHLLNFPFYSPEERKYRYIRDQLLTLHDYEGIMWSLIAERSFDVELTKESIWVDREEIMRLGALGHSIGLHSHTHPTAMSNLSTESQKEEYVVNQKLLSDIIYAEPTMMAHPCGSYSIETINILEALGVTLGFRSSMTPGMSSSLLEIPREDHSNIMAAMFGR